MCNVAEMQKYFGKEKKERVDAHEVAKTSLNLFSSEHTIQSCSRAQVQHIFTSLGREGGDVWAAKEGDRGQVMVGDETGC